MELKERPKLKLPKTLLEVIFDGVTLVLLIGSIIYLVSVWSSLPAEVPAHYNATGEIDRWGSKWEMIILPIIASTMWISMSALEKYPHVYNYPKLTKKNVRDQYMNGRKMVNVLKNISTLLFTYLTWTNIQISLGHAESLGSLFLPIFLISIFGPMIYFVHRSFRL